MEGPNKKTQGAAFGLIALAVVVLAGGFLYNSKSTTSSTTSPGASSTPAPQAQTQSAPSGEHPSNCPTGIVGEKLGADVFKGHASAADGSSGAGLQVVYSDGPGAKAGLQSGDIVLKCNETPTTCPKGLMEALDSVKEGEKTVLTIDRKGKSMQIEIPAADAPAAK